MPISASLLPEFDHEMATTRKLLERVPADKAAWKPHVKSMSLGDLALHIAMMLTWGNLTLEQAEFDMNPPGGPGYTPPTYESKEALLATFDKNVAAFRTALAATPDAALMVPWSLKSGGQAIFSQPRIGVLRGMIMNHIIHHRGQLSVYLRMNDVPLPGIYGPSADSAA